MDCTVGISRGAAAPRTAGLQAANEGDAVQEEVLRTGDQVVPTGGLIAASHPVLVASSADHHERDGARTKLHQTIRMHALHFLLIQLFSSDYVFLYFDFAKLLIICNSF